MNVLLHTWTWVLPGVSVGTGTLLLCVGVLLYETQTKRVGEKLEEIWIRIDELRRITHSKEAAFLVAVTGTIERLIVRGFGKKLFSVRALVLSTTFSFSSYFLTSIAIVDSHLTRSEFGALLSTGLIAMGLGILQIFKPDLLIIRIIFVLLFLYSTVPLTLDMRFWGLLLLTTIILGILTDFAFLVYFRWTIRRVQTLKRTRDMLRLLLLNTAVAGAITLPSLYYATFVGRNKSIWSPWESGPLSLGKWNGLVFYCGAALLQSCFTNYVDLILSIWLVGTIWLLLVQRMVWPLLQHPVYAPIRYNLLGNSKLLGTAGLALILAGIKTGRLHDVVIFVKNIFQ